MKNKDIEKMEDIDFAIMILNEKINKLTNPYAPLTLKLKKVVRSLENLKDKNKKA